MKLPKIKFREMTLEEKIEIGFEYVNKIFNNDKSSEIAKK